MLHFLLPQENKFYLMLDELGKLSNQSVRELHHMIMGGEQAAGSALRIDDTKNRAKVVIQQMTSDISNTLITPFDREDLQELSVELYRIPKLVQKIKNRVLNHHLKDRNGDFSNFTKVILECSEAMDEVLDELAGKLHTRNIPTKAALLDQLEDQGDQLLEDTLIESFQSVEDVKELVLRKGVYQMLETVTDLYQDAANVALRIVLKHS